MLTRAVLVAAVMLSVSTAGCGRPFVLLPGGALEGSTVATPESWSFTDDVKTVQLETLPADPYSVNIWVIALDGNLYVHAGANRATWVENIEADPSVRLRVDDSIYELVASRVGGQEESTASATPMSRSMGAARATGVLPRPTCFGSERAQARFATSPS